MKSDHETSTAASLARRDTLNRGSTKPNLRSVLSVPHYCKSKTVAPKIIILALIDDLGYADAQPNGAHSPTPSIGSLAASGVQFNHLHAYKYCSPSRRSLLSGRFPVHISGKQAPICSNFLPLQLTLLSSKMQRANYTTAFIGKGHLGYETTDHLPTRRGFDPHLGCLAGDQQYEYGLQVMCDVPEIANLPDATWHGHWPPREDNLSTDTCHLDMWSGGGGQPASPATLATHVYSTQTYTTETIRLIKATHARKGKQPLFIYLA